jgi:glycosyltransferase involved in cell wall biosynthesis
MTRGEALKVGIDAGSVSPDRSGGVATGLGALIRALGRLDDGGERYTVIADSDGQADWLGGLAGSNTGITVRRGGPAGDGATAAARLKRLLGPLLPKARAAQRLIALPRSWPEVPVSDGFHEALGCDVIHFATQRFVVCAAPTVYSPHDLQHLHYPQFWSPHDLVWRETIYPAGCRFAHTVTVNTEWTKQDVIRQYRVAPEKVQVIPEGPPTNLQARSTVGSQAETRSRYGLEEGFAVYPAATWPHKNHLGLLDALALLRDERKCRIPLVCTGSRDARFWPRIERRIADLALGSQVRFLGFVPDDDLRAICRMARFLVQPSLFEASSLPIFDAWLEGVPVACANATALPEQVMDAALLFDPTSPASVAEAMARISSDAELRQDLRSRGYERVKDFDWERTARCYRAVYRRAAGWPLSEEDRWLLGWNWMREPKRARSVIDE